MNNLNKLVVKIDNKKTPISIGDIVHFNDSDNTDRYVTSMRIDEDGRVSYLLEWAVNNDISSRWITYSELKILNNIKQTTKVGF